MALVLLDVDGTLLDNPSSELRFIGRLLRQGTLGPSQWTALLWFYVRWWPRYGNNVPRKNKAYLKGLSVTELADEGEAFVVRDLAPQLRPWVVERIQAHQEHGDEVVLVTGTPEFVAAPLARHLGVHYWAATRCDQRQGRYTAAPPTEHPYGAEKLTAARRLCRQLGYRLGEAVAYADSRHDIPLLEAVAQAVAVTPDATLATRAREAGWEIMEPPSVAQGTAVHSSVKR